MSNCKSRQTMETEAVKKLLPKIKKGNPKLSHKEALRLARDSAPAIVDAAIKQTGIAVTMDSDTFADEVDAREELPKGAVSEANAGTPMVGKSPVNIVSMSKENVQVTFHNNKKVYNYTPMAISLDQGSLPSIVDKYKNLPGSQAISSNAVQMAIPATLPTMVVSEEVRKLNELWQNRPSKANLEAVINAEIAHGYRNADGVKIVKLVSAKPAVLGSSADPLFESGQFEQLFVNEDGKMDKSLNVEALLINIDKKNQGENFDEEFSSSLSNTLSRVVSAIDKFHDMDIKFGKNTFDEMEAAGRYYIQDGSVFVAVDDNGPEAKFRHSMSMGNQEAYVHELVHAALSFIMDPKNINIAKDTELANFVSSLQSLYTYAAEKSTWETLLPGINEGTQYNSNEIKAAKDKWDYIFNNSNARAGLQEFAAAILTNKMFKDGMETLKTVRLKEAHKGESAFEAIHRFFGNLIERLVGFATGKGGKSVTTEGAKLIFDIMRANHNSQDVAAKNVRVNSINKTFEKVGESITVGNDAIKKITDPFLNAFGEVESIRKEGEKIGLDDVKEFVALKKKLDKILDSAKSNKTADEIQSQKASLKSVMENVISIVKTIAAFLRAMPTIYKMRQITKGHKVNKQIAERYATSINKLLESVGLAKDGIVRNIIRDVKDRPGLYNYLADSLLRLTYEVDGARQRAFEGVMQDLSEDFGDVMINNDRLNAANNEALTEVLLRTDMQSLGLDLEGLTELLRDPEMASTKWKELSANMSEEQKFDAIQHARYMVNGEGTPSNAKVIYRGHKGSKVGTASVSDIDKAISYKALEMVEDRHKQKLLDFIEGKDFVDYSRTVTNKMRKAAGLELKAMNKEEYVKQVAKGIDTFMIRAYGAQQVSAKELANTPHKLIKGYMKETYNTNDSLETHPLRDKAKLIKDGYTFIRSAGKLPGTTVEYGMFLSNAPTRTRADGTIGLKDRKARGFSLMDIINNESEEDITGGWDRTRKRKAFNKLLADVTKKYKAAPGTVKMSPVYDGDGEIADFRVFLSKADKLKYLKMETSGTKNLAHTYSNNGLADTTTTHNKEIVNALYKDFQSNYKGHEEDYAVIQPLEELDATDYGLTDTSISPRERRLREKKKQQHSKYSELWARLPKDTKEYARSKFKTGAIIVRKDLLAITFGNDDLSMTDNKLFDNVSEKTRARVKKVESIWKDTMQIAKGNIVIKTPEVLEGNIWSNFKILLYLGINPVKGSKLMLLASKELKRYEADRSMAERLKRDRDSGKKGLDNRIASLEKAMGDNSVAPLVKAGLYQSIVEDVNTANDTNRVSEWFVGKSNKYISNETANSVLQHVFLTRKTKIYQGLLKATQTSDFYARYAQYYAEIEKETKKYKANHNISVVPEDVVARIEAKAKRNAIDNYINYEAPLEQHIRYGDAMGPFFFVKYWERAQKVISKLIRENPLRVGADKLMQRFIGNTSDIVDAAWWSKGLSTFNPFKIFERLMELIFPPGAELAFSIAG